MGQYNAYASKQKSFLNLFRTDIADLLEGYFNKYG